MTAEKLGILGGTFDPVHLGHLILGEAAREEAGLDRVLFVPTGHSWRKPDRVITPGAMRLEMLRLGTVDNPYFEVSGVEVDRPGPSYSDVTLEELAEANPGAELFFIIGTDALADMPNWRAPKRIVELATLVVAERAGSERSAEVEALPGRLGARAVWLGMPVIDISATDIRERVRLGRSIRYLCRMRSPRTFGSSGLYRG